LDIVLGAYCSRIVGCLTEYEFRILNPRSEELAGWDRSLHLSLANAMEAALTLFRSSDATQLPFCPPSNNRRQEDDGDQQVD